MGSSTPAESTLEKVLKALRYGHHEAVVVTVDGSGKPHAAAMGVKAQGKDLVIFPYVSTRTYRNITQGSSVSLALTQDSTVFCRVVVEPRELKFKEGRSRGTYILDDNVDLYIEALPRLLSEDSKRAFILLKVLDAYEGRGSLIAFSRANALLIESLVYLTKIRALLQGSPSRDCYELGRWLEVLRYSISLVKRLGSEELIRCADAVVDEVRKLGLQL